MVATQGGNGDRALRGGVARDVERVDDRERERGTHEAVRKKAPETTSAVHAAAGSSSPARGDASSVQPNALEGGIDRDT